jgi:Na+/melibiose symporter-like transporter
MLNIEFFRNPRFTAASISVTLVFFALFGSLFFLTQYLQFVLGYSALEAGIRVAPIALVLIVVSPVAGRLVNQLGNKALVVAGMSVVAVGLWILSTITVASGYPHVLVSLMILGTGMALAMTPATESIMGSLPLAKAGVGSAMNDTTRQIGGALGVAILGSVFASAYTAALAPAAGHLPVTLASAADNSVGSAIAIGQQMGGAAGSALVTAAKPSFIHGMDVGLLVGAADVLIGVIVALVWLPNRPQTVAAIELSVDRREGGLATVVERVEA